MSLENIKQCEMCRKPFQSYGGKICGSCLDEIEIYFSRIKDYLYDHPERIGVKQLSEKTEVPQKVILHLMREGRIEIADDSKGGLLCEVCKKPISKGTMCESCKLDLARSLDSTKPKPEYKEKDTPLSEKRSSRMHVKRDRID